MGKDFRYFPYWLSWSSQWSVMVTCTRAGRVRQGIGPTRTVLKSELTQPYQIFCLVVQSTCPTNCHFKFIILQSKGFSQKCRHYGLNIWWNGYATWCFQKALYFQTLLTHSLCTMLKSATDLPTGYQRATGGEEMSMCICHTHTSVLYIQLMNTEFKVFLHSFYYLLSVVFKTFQKTTGFLTEILRKRQSKQPKQNAEGPATL